MRRLREGDREAFDVVYDAYRSRLFGFLARLCGRRDAAEDLLQETWIRLARTAHRLDPDTRLGPWLFTVARNLYLSHRRWAVLDLDRLTELSLWPGGSIPSPSPFEHAAGSELERRLEAALASLPVVYREVLLLVGVDGMSPAEAAEVLALRPDALRQRLARARGMMRQRLESTT